MTILEALENKKKEFKNQYLEEPKTLLINENWLTVLIIDLQKNSRTNIKKLKYCLGMEVVETKKNITYEVY